MRVEGDLQRDGAVCVRGAVTAEHLSLATDGEFVEDFCNAPMDHPLFPVLWTAAEG